MKTFKQTLHEAAGKNTHMTHIEDLVLDGGVKGARQAILALRSLRDMLSGNTSTGVDVTVKWDGAPAIFAGEDPSDGKFFIAKKGIFNANPKVYKSHEDIKADTSGDLQGKLIKGFDNLKNLGITSVIQGDFMFEKKDLKVENINGIKHVVFHPNTIAYAIPLTDPLAKIIQNSEIGIVWHTSYSGLAFETMRAEFGRDITSKLKASKKVWMVDAKLPSVDGAVLTASQTKKVTEKLQLAGVIFKKIASKTLKEIELNKELNLVMNIWNNRMVREGQRIKDTTKHAKGLVDFVRERYQKEIDKVKTPASKEKKADKRDELLVFFSTQNIKNLALVYDLQNYITDAKLIIINKLNSLSSIGTFVKTKSGFKVTNPEGFVAIDRMEGGAVKLVNRLEFSANNFSKDIIKGWDSPN